MFYQNLKFPEVAGRPFFYTNFVQTLDGKVQVEKQGYWPIGSKKDYQVLTELRAYAECLIHGGNLAREFAEITLKSISKPLFKQMRRVLGKSRDLPYYILTNHPNTIHITHPLLKVVDGDLQALVKKLQEKKYKHILVEGGPFLLGSFFKEDLIDEVFLTISPKIYGTDKATKNLVEGILFPPLQVKKFHLLSVKKVENEIFLRYRVV